MRIEAALAEIEICKTTDELKTTLQEIIENYGFQSFNMLDAGNPHIDIPFYIGTTPEAWVEDYKGNGFVHVDPCVARVRRTNMPFTWADIAAQRYGGVGRKAGSVRIMEAACDHGFTEGYVVPFHYRDKLGRLHSSSSAFYWTDDVQKFRFLISRNRFDLHLIMIYWAQRTVDIIAKKHRGGKKLFDGYDNKNELKLTDRERDVLAWAARGKTQSDTADILTIAESTVETYMRHAIEKLGACNKTDAVVKSLYLGLIDI